MRKGRQTRGDDGTLFGLSVCGVCGLALQEIVMSPWLTVATELSIGTVPNAIIVAPWNLFASTVCRRQVLLTAPVAST